MRVGTEDPGLLHRVCLLKVQRFEVQISHLQSMWADVRGSRATVRMRKRL